MMPGLELVMTLRVEIAVPLEIGAIGTGIRRVIPITGGTFEGPAIRGVVIPGGADWNLTRPDGTADVWARYTLRADDGVLIGVVNAGIVVPQADGSIFARTVPQFEVAEEHYMWLRRSIFVGTLMPADSGDAVRLQFYRVT
jgi:hypothetical protein